MGAIAAALQNVAKESEAQKLFRMAGNVSEILARLLTRKVNVRVLLAQLLDVANHGESGHETYYSSE